MPHVVPSTRDEALVVCNYDATGLEWVDLFDNHLLGWIIDETSAVAPGPAAIGTLPPKAPDTAPVLSPQWAVAIQNSLFVPDLWRGTFSEFLTWLATNGEAKRKVGGEGLRTSTLFNQYQQWAQSNPSLVYTR